MEESCNVVPEKSTDMMTLSISAEFEKHCIKITDLDKQIKDIDLQLEQLQKTLQERTSSVSSLEDEMQQLLKKQSELIGKKVELQDEVAQQSSQVKQLIAGKTSGVTGGAVVEIEKNGKRKHYMLKNIFNTTQKYKNIFGKEKQHSGNHFYDPNCKSETRSFFTRHSLKEVNDSVIQEFIALKLANVVSPGIAPDAILGKIADDGNGEQGPVRYCLLTEMAGQGDGEKFNTLDDISQTNTAKPYGVNKAIWKSFFAIGIGLLNDKDVAKKDNVGVVTKGNGQDADLSLFDLGHASPDEFKLDKKTLLPKSKSKIADGALSFINLFTPANSIPGTFYFDNDIQNVLSVDDRREALGQLLEKKDEILDALKKIKNEIAGNDVSGDGKNVVEDMERRIQARFDQLDKITQEYDKWHDNQLRKVQTTSSGQIDLLQYEKHDYEAKPE